MGKRHMVLWAWTRGGLSWVAAPFYFKHQAQVLRPGLCREQGWCPWISHDFPDRKVVEGVEEAQGKIPSGLKTGFLGQPGKRGSKDGVLAQMEGSSLPGMASPLDPAKVVHQVSGEYKVARMGAGKWGRPAQKALCLPTSPYSWEWEGRRVLLLLCG